MSINEATTTSAMNSSPALDSQAQATSGGGPSADRQEESSSAPPRPSASAPENASASASANANATATASASASASASAAASNNGPTNGVSESAFNLPLLDPSRWGWTASGGVAELIPPHEVS